MQLQEIQKQQTNNNILSEESLNDLILSTYPTHPFETTISNEHIEYLLNSYLAMSQAFPFIQAAASGKFIFPVLDSGETITQDVEITSVIGTFLVWDEFGGWYATLGKGNKALPNILNTNAFHCNLLKDDLAKFIARDNIKPEYNEPTRKYLKSLFNGLSHVDKVIRCAFMVSFEMHAHRMIEGLWSEVSRIFNVKKDKLIYFDCHVGGDDPAEVYHVEMTSKMIDKLVGPNDLDRFQEELIKAYKLHLHWCKTIKMGKKYNA